MEPISDTWIRSAQLAGGTGTFKLSLRSNEWEWTPQIAVLFGFDPSGSRSRFDDWEGAIFVDDVPKVRGALEAAKNGGSFYAEFRVRHPDGSLHWLAGRGKVERANQAMTAGSLVPTLKSRIVRRSRPRLLALNETLEARVQDRARQLEASFEQLRESERRFRLLVEALTDYAIFMLDPEGNIVNWNTGAERIKRYRAEEIIGQHFSRFYTDADRRNRFPKES